MTLARHARKLLHPLSLVTFAGSAALLAGLITLGSTPFSVPTASTQPLTLRLSWSHELDDAPCGVAEASPVGATLDRGGPSVEFGDRAGDLYAFHLSGGTVPPGWSGPSPSAVVGPGGACGITANDGAVARPAKGFNGIAVPDNPPVDSTASVQTSAGSSAVYFGAGNAAEPDEGGYYAYGSGGTLIWHQVVANPPTDHQPADGIQASPTLVSAGGVPFVVAGSLGQESDAIVASDGNTLAGWPFFSADTVFSTAAAADLYGTGSTDLVVGGASTGGFADGRHYQDGGHLRILNSHGGLVCSANTTEEVDSSPAVGPILAGGALGIVTGTGSYYSNSADEDTVKAFDTECNQVWSQTLGGATGGSPALADLGGNGVLDVVEGTSSANGTGSVSALNASTGAVVWTVPVLGEVIGSVVTADLSGTGVQDVIVATTRGVEILDGRHGAELVHLDDGSGHAGVARGKVYGFQNAPLVTDDPDGRIGITVAGYSAVRGSIDNDVQGMVQHFTVDGSDGALADESGGWPQFHHDPQLSGFTGSPPEPPLGCQVPSAAADGYLMTAADGGVFAFGGLTFCGSTGDLHLNQPVVGMAVPPDRGGYWLVAADGGVFSFGVPYYGSAGGGFHLTRPIVGIAATPDGLGYWLVGADGGIFTFGDARFYGSAAARTAGQHVVGMASTSDGQGYWEVTSNGEVFTFGDAGFFGDARRLHLAAPIVGITPDPATGGYWLIASNGGVFSFEAPFFGSTGPIPLNQPVVGMEATDDGRGYWIVAADGGVFSYGDAPYMGSNGSTRLNKPVVAIAGF